MTVGKIEVGEQDIGGAMVVDDLSRGLEIVCGHRFVALTGYGQPGDTLELLRRDPAV